MLYLLYGPDGHSKFRKLRSLLSGLEERNPGLLRASFDLEDGTHVDPLKDFVGTPGLFSMGKRVAVVRNGLSSMLSPACAGIAERAASDDALVLFLYESAETKKLSKEASAFCKKYRVTADFFPVLEGEDLYKAILAYAKELGVTIDKRAMSFLEDEHGGDLRAIASDMDKWSAVTKTITGAFLLKSGEYREDVGLFEFCQSILYRKPLRDRLTMFEYMLSQGTDLFAAYNIMAKMTSSRDSIDALAHADSDIKKGLLDMEQAMLTIVLN